MKITVTIETDSNDLAAIGAQIAGVVRGPEFVRTLVDAMAPELVWCTYEQARAFTGQGESTFDRWIKVHREPGADGCPALVISHALGKKDPRIRLDSLQSVFNFRAPALPAINGAQLLHTAGDRR